MFKFRTLWSWHHAPLSEKGQEQQERLTSFYSAGLMIKYGFISMKGHRVIDTRYKYLTGRHSIVQLNPFDFFNDVWMEAALKRARNTMKARAFKYREKSQLEHVVDNLTVPSSVAMTELASMSEALQTPPAPRRTRKSH